MAREKLAALFEKEMFDSTDRCWRMEVVLMVCEDAEFGKRAKRLRQS